VVDKENKKEEIKLTADGIYTSDPDLNLSLNVGTVSEMVMVDPLEIGAFDYTYPGTPDMFEEFEEKELRDKFPSLQRAWENYKILLQLCRSELEKNED
jgi:hypothetical protein